MKLTKEQVYINLKGKSKEELTDLWEFLNNAGENQFRKTINDFLNNCYGWTAYEFSCNYWLLSSSTLLSEKTEVTIEQLKEILQPVKTISEIKLDENGSVVSVKSKPLLFDVESKEILQPIYNKGEQLRAEAKERGYTYDNFRCLINRELEGLEDIDKWHYEECVDTLYTMPDSQGGNVVYRDGVWAEKVSESLEQQLQKAEAEVKRLKEAIEEDSKIKVGDWCTFWNHDKNKFVISKFQGNKFVCMATGDYLLNCEKITNKELINKLNELLTIKK